MGNRTSYRPLDERRNISYGARMTIHRIRIVLAVLIFAGCCAAAPVPAPISSVPIDRAALQAALLEEREKSASIEREVQDLAAQSSMAESAQQQLRSSWAQVWIAGLGTLGLGASLAFSFLALSGTRKAMRLQRDSSKKQLRAYLGVEKVVLREFEDAKRPSYGVTPAFNLVEEMAISIQPRSTVYDLERSPTESGVTVQPGQSTVTLKTLAQALTAEDIKSIRDDEERAIIVCGVVEYETMGERQRTEFALRFNGKGSDHRLLPKHNVNT
jgi:hypothetical protein